MGATSRKRSTKRIHAILLLALSMVFFFDGGAPAEADRTVVAWVNDGDTVTLSDGRRVRYIGINAPEIGHKEKPAEPYGQEAWRANRGLVQGKAVRMETDREPKDHYDRYLAYVFLEDGTFVNGRLVALGFAYVLKNFPNTRYEEELLEKQREAMSLGRGMWGRWLKKPRSVIGNRRSHRFHQPGCIHEKGIAPSNRITFPTAWEAFWHGYAPGKMCDLQSGKASE